MNSTHDYPNIVLGLRTEIERKISELEAICFDTRACEDKTLSARSKRLQLIAVMDYINCNASKL